MLNRSFYNLMATPTEAAKGLAWRTLVDATPPTDPVSFVANQAFLRSMKKPARLLTHILQPACSMGPNAEVALAWDTAAPFVLNT